ncbi:MAG: thrombospondin type 3 repeat-containing protein [Gammaproteobacteria bacterium]
MKLKNLLALCALALVSFNVTTAHAAPDCSVYTGARLMQWPAGNPVWEFCWRSPEFSQPQNDGSGLELFEVTYNGHLVFDRTHVPILNVEYGPGGCGCFRDWLDSEVRFEADATPGGVCAETNNSTSGLCEVESSGRTICDCAPSNTCDDNPGNACNVDVGGYEGVAAFEDSDTLELTTQTRAGWYRYTMRWKFHLDGTIEPGFGFGATPNGCTDASHFHHGYYRFDFDIDGADNDQMYSLAAESGLDTDADLIDDAIDNCQLVSNADQTDADNDGFGNACDTDLNNDGITNVIDLGILRSLFFTDDATADFNSDGVVNVVDLGILRSFFFAQPGPAGSGSVQTAINEEESGYAGTASGWMVQDTVTGRGYRLEPGSADQKLSADTFDPVPFAAGDYWVLAESANEIDDGISFGSGCAAQLDDFVNNESVASEDLVFWYRFGTHHIGLDECFCGEIGPRLVPIGDWSVE